MSVPARTPFQVYDTTLRDGAQQEGINLSVSDKLAIAPLLDELGVGFIEGGWPGAVPKDTEFFKRAAKELDFRNAELAAFGSTRKAGTRAVDDPQVRALVDSEAPVVALVAKHDLRHAERALRTTGDENIAMIADTVAFLVREGRRVVVDAEHFFDGYRFDPAYSRAAVLAGFEAGAEVVALCDTNGGMVPTWVADIVHEIREAVGPDAILGIHAHNDSGCAVANTLAAVEAGCTHVQGTVNGYGERTGNADLLAVVANLQLKYGLPVLKVAERAARRAARADPDRARDQRDHQHLAVRPLAVRRGQRVRAQGRHPRLGDQGGPGPLPAHRPCRRRQRHAHADLRHGRARVDRAQGPRARVRPVGAPGAARPGHRTGQGRRGRAATPTRRRTRPSSCCCSRRSTGSVRCTSASSRGGPSSSARAAAARRRRPRRRSSCTPAASGSSSTGEGNGPVNALDHALRLALMRVYPELEDFELIDFKVRILDSMHGTDAVTRVLIEMTDGQRSLEHRRRRAQPARGVVGGAHGLGHLGVAEPRRAAALKFIPALSSAAA